jgi:branched-chain amino acid transport system ATP-binding protein
MLATARALMNQPRLLMLDEPSIGLSPIMTAEIGKIVQQINALGVSVILVEQNAMLALSIAQRSYVLETGHIVMQGEARALLQDEGVKKAYLGL